MRARLPVTMSWFDLGAVLVVALAVFDGARNGLAWAALEAALLVTAALGARGLGPHAEPYLLKIADLPADELRSTAHLTVFLAFAAAFGGILFLIHPASKRWRFRHDRWFGGTLGLATGTLGSLLLFSIVMWSRPRLAVEDALAESRLLAVLRTAKDNGMAGLLPVHVTERVVQLERP